MNNTELNQSDRCLYVSCAQRSGSSALYILLYVIAAAVVLFTVCGNMLVIISVIHFKQLHTSSNILILSLAVTDFLIGGFVMAPMFIWVIESCWILGSNYCMYIILAGTVLGCLSIYNIVLIAVDRYFVLSNPLVYPNIMSLRKIRVVIVFHWCVWVSYSLTILLMNGNFNLLTVCPGECSLIMAEVSVIIDLVTALIFPCSVIIILYTGVFVIVKRHATAIREINNFIQSRTHTNSIRSERKAAKALGILVAVFLICLLPYFIYSFFSTFSGLQVKGIQIFLIIVYMNSTINPVIYALFYPWFRKCVKIIITLQILQTGSSLINVLI